MSFDTYMQIGDGSDVVGEATASGIPTGAFVFPTAERFRSSPRNAEFKQPETVRACRHAWPRRK